MTDDLDVKVNSIPMWPVPLPRSGGSMLVSQTGEQALCVNDELTIRQARGSIAELLAGEPDSRFSAHANGVAITSAAMPATAVSMWIEFEDDTVFVLNEDLRLRDSQPHATEQLTAVTSAPIEAHRAS